MTYIKINEFEKAIQDCNEALALDDAHIKSYVRRAKANFRLDNLK